MHKSQTILIVDPESDFLEWAQHQLETPTTRVLTATNSDEGFKIFSRENQDLLIAETHLVPLSGTRCVSAISKSGFSREKILNPSSEFVAVNTRVVGVSS